MGDTLKKVTAGQRLQMPASTFNTFIDVARAWLADQQATGGEGRIEARQTGTILVRNDTDTDLPQFAVLGISGVVFTATDNEAEFRRRQCYTGIAPTVAGHFGGWFCVLSEPLADGKIGRAVVDGVTPVKVNVVDEDHWFADVADDDTDKLTSGPDGAAQILIKEPGTGQKWAVVRLGIGTNGFWARITDCTEISSDPHRFEYTFEEVKKTGTGYDGWVSVSGGLSGTAYNGNELTDLFGWCSDRVVGMVVRMRRVQFGSTVEYWFNAWNVS
jgi:hypothetical protein